MPCRMRKPLVVDGGEITADVDLGVIRILAQVLLHVLRGFVDTHVRAAGVAGGHHGAFQHLPGKVHQGMVENAVFKAGGVDQALFGVVDLEGAEFSVGKAGSADVIAEAVEIGVEMLQEGLHIAAVAFAFGGFVKGKDEVFVFGDGFKGDQGAFHWQDSAE